MVKKFTKQVRTFINLFFFNFVRSFGDNDQQVPRASENLFTHLSYLFNLSYLLRDHGQEVRRAGDNFLYLFNFIYLDR
jgi:hypothetical protein